jgi:hypothetical protein
VITEALGERSLVTGRLKEVGRQKTMKSLSIEFIGNTFKLGFWQSRSQANFVNNKISLEQFPLQSGVVTVFCLSDGK